MCRDHVLRQPLREVPAPLAVTRLVPRFADEISHQSLLAACLGTRKHDSFEHRRVLAKHGLNLAQLDTETAYLDLVIDSTQELDVTVWQIAREVACAVEARSGASVEGIGNELLRSQSRAIKVATRQAVAADIELADHAEGHWLQMGVEHVDLRVEYGSSDRRLGRPRIWRVAGHERCDAVGFGRAVKVM